MCLDIQLSGLQVLFENDRRSFQNENNKKALSHTTTSSPHTTLFMGKIICGEKNNLCD